MNQQDIDKYLDIMITNAEKDIDRTFATRLKEILAEIAKMFEKYAQSDGKLTWTDMNKFNRLQKEMAVIAENMSGQYQYLLKSLQNLNENIYLEDFMRSSYLYELTAQTAMNVSIPSIDTIRKAILNPIEKLTLSVLMQSHRTDIINKLHITISQSLMVGEDYAAMARRIQRIVGFSAAKARNVAVTEAGRVQTQARLDSAEQASRYADLTKVWLSTLDTKTRPDHRKLDGQEADKDGYFHIHEFKAKGPHLFGVAKEDCNCRCTVIMKVNGILPDTRRARDYQDADYQQKLADRADQLMNDQGMTEKQVEKQAKKEISAPNSKIPFQSYQQWYDSLTTQQQGKNGLDNNDQPIKKLGAQALQHANAGEFTNPKNPKKQAIGKMSGGGHGQANIDLLNRHGIPYNIVKTMPNGVRLGNVPDHKIRSKRTGTGQTWFPKDWTEEDINAAAVHVANLTDKQAYSTKQYMSMIKKFGMFKNVRVGIIYDKKQQAITTIFPDIDQKGSERDG